MSGDMYSICNDTESTGFSERILERRSDSGTHLAARTDQCNRREILQCKFRLLRLRSHGFAQNLNLDIRRCKIGRLFCGYILLLHLIRQGKMHQRHLRFRVGLLFQLRLLEANADLDRAVLGLYFHTVPLFIRDKETDVVEQRVGLIDRALFTENLFRILVQRFHIGIVIIPLCALCDRGHDELRIIGNCIGMLQGGGNKNIVILIVVDGLLTVGVNQFQFRILGDPLPVGAGCLVFIHKSGFLSLFHRNLLAAQRGNNSVANLRFLVGVLYQFPRAQINFKILKRRLIDIVKRKQSVVVYGKFQIRIRFADFIAELIHYCCPYRNEMILFRLFFLGFFDVGTVHVQTHTNRPVRGGLDIVVGADLVGVLAPHIQGKRQIVQIGEINVANFVRNGRELIVPQSASVVFHKCIRVDMEHIVGVIRQRRGFHRKEEAVISFTDQLAVFLFQ